MWPFTRRPALIRPPIAENWRPGDLAECLRDDWHAPDHRRPVRGARAIVVAVHPGHVRWRRLGWCLQLVGFPGLWDATAFRKVEPGAIEPVRAAQLIDA